MENLEPTTVQKAGQAISSPCENRNRIFIVRALRLGTARLAAMLEISVKAQKLSWRTGSADSR
jgi:hypothetical protein